MLLDACSIPGKEWLFWHTRGDLVCRGGDKSVGASWEFEPIPLPLVLCRAGTGIQRVVLALEMLLGEAALMAEGGGAVPSLPPLHFGAGKGDQRGDRDRQVTGSCSAQSSPLVFPVPLGQGMCFGVRGQPWGPWEQWGDRHVPCHLLPAPRPS